MTTQGGGGAIGYGQMRPNDGTDSFNAICFMVQQMIAQIDTMKIVRVEKVTAGSGTPPAAGTVDVLPLVSQIDGNGNVTEHGTVHGIPFFRLQGGKNAVICDPEVGDIGYVVIADRDISNVRSAKKPSPPGSRRKYDVADGVYVGSILADAPEQYAWFTSTGIKVHDKSGNEIELLESGIKLTDKSGNVVEMKTGGVFVTGNLIVSGALQLAGGIKNAAGATYAGNIETTGEVIAKVGGGQVGLSTHVHTQPNDSHGDAEQPTAAPTGGS